MIDFLDRLINKQKAIRRSVLIWAMYLVTHVTLIVFQNLPLITTSVVAAYTLVVGLVATAIAFYTQGRNKDDQRQGTQ